MRLSYHWLKQYIDLNESPEKVGERLTDCGLEVEGLEEFCSIEGGLQGIVIGEVLECQAHPDADRLTVCKVDLGDGDPVQIVCGAPNVAEGQKVPVATVGTTLYSGDESFKIKKSKIRGQVSFGMICAEDELGLGNSHDGIMVLDSDAKPGTPGASYFGITKDHVYEIGLTPNRPDAASHIGSARDLVAVYNAESGKADVSLKIPDVSSFKVDDHSLEIPVKVEDSTLCPRYSGITLSNIKVSESPKWMQDRLLAAGIRPLNSVVDITNYVLLETGHPLHAFDAQKIRGAEVIIKTLPEGTEFQTLDENDRKLSADDLMICDKEGGMCIAGVFGGSRSGVTETTSSIFLESAYFNPVSIRKTARRHLLNTDASFRFERGADPEMTIYALKRACLLLKDICGATISSEIIDIYPKKIERQKIELKRSTLDTLCGVHIEDDLVELILTDLDFNILSADENAWLLEVPSAKVDVTREADVVEEVLRVYGYNRVPMPDKISFSPDIHSYGDEESLRNLVSDHLSARGFAETMTNSLTNARYASLIPGIAEQTQVRMLNALSSELDVMRQSLVPGALETIRYNLNRQNPNLRIYEFGKTYQDEKEGSKERFRERWILSVFMTGRINPENWKEQSRNADAFDLAHEIEQLCTRLGIEIEKTETIQDGLISNGLQYEADSKVILRYGELASKIASEFDIQQPVVMAEIDWDLMQELASVNKVGFIAVPKFPEVRRDLALVLNKGVTYEEIRKIALQTERKLLTGINLFDVYEGEKLEAGKVSYAVSFTLRDREKTLNDKAIEKTMRRLIQAFKEQLGAELR